MLNNWICREKYMHFFFCEILIVVFSLRLYSCLANGSADEFQKGEHLYKTKSVKEVLQIGMHNVSVIWYICLFIVKVETGKVYRNIWCNVLDCLLRYFKIIPPMAGFHLSASVIPPQGLQQAKGNFNVAVVFDRRRISSCTCTCNSQPSWCSHVVALCLYRIHQVRTAIVNRCTPIMSSIGNCCMLCIWNGYYDAW